MKEAKSMFEESGESGMGYIKCGVYGNPGAGKTYTALKIGTALGTTALLDVERGAEPFRRLFKNPDGTPFLVAPIGNLNQAFQALEEAIERKVEVVIVDQMTFLWEMAQEMYIEGERRKQSKTWSMIEDGGNLPMLSWSKIKKPYRRFIRALMDVPVHVFMLGRLSMEYKMEGGELIRVGEKMAAEKWTPYEPTILIKMEYDKRKKVNLALVEKDRFGELNGQVFENPGVEMFDPILKLLGRSHALLPEIEEGEEEKEEAEKDPISPKQVKLITRIALRLRVGEKEVAKALKTMDIVRAGEVLNRLALKDTSDFS